jgi:hypothetical protein
MMRLEGDLHGALSFFFGPIILYHSVAVFLSSLGVSHSGTGPGCVSLDTNLGFTTQGPISWFQSVAPILWLLPKIT